jgi:hypothetical protein
MPGRAAWFCLIAMLLACPGPVMAQQRVEQKRVDLQLILAVDASGSVSQGRFELQKRGYVEALRNPRVLQAIQSGASQSIAVSMVQWTGPSLHVLALDWMEIHDAASAEAAAKSIEDFPRRLFGGGTSISGMIDFGMTLFARSPFGGERRVIDISGDGANNSGRPVDEARDDAVDAGVVINGLPILNIEPNLDVHYREHVIGGSGAFMVAISSYDSFADAILRKLISEIAAAGSRIHADSEVR